MTPVEFLISYRLKKACELLITTKKSILEIALECGFNNSSYFGKLFKQQYHTSPGEYAWQHKTAGRFYIPPAVFMLY